MELPSNPNVLTDEQIQKEIAGMEGADTGLGSLMKILTGYSDFRGDIGIRLHSKDILPRLNSVLSEMREEGLIMNWSTIQLRLGLKINDIVGGRYGQTLSEDEYKWSQMQSVVNIIQEGLSRRSSLFNPEETF